MHSGAVGVDVVDVVDEVVLLGVVVALAVVLAVLTGTVTVFVFVLPQALSVNAAPTATTAAASLMRWCSGAICAHPSCPRGSACEYPRAEG
jgi:hypothetical protein